MPKPKPQDVVRFEIRVKKDGRWTVNAILRTRDDATDQAQFLAGRGGCQEVEVVRRVMRNDLPRPEKDKHVLRVPCQAKERTINIRPVDAAPYCDTYHGFYGYEARRTLGRLLRDFLDRWAISATELLYWPAHQKRLRDADSLLAGGIERIATLQAHRRGEDPRARRDALYAMVDQIEEAADTAPVLYVEDVADGFRGIIDQTGGLGSFESQHTLMTAVTAHLGGAATLGGKLERVMALCADCDDDLVLALLDTTVAEFLDVPEVVQELLGRQPDLASAIEVLGAVCTGRYEAKTWDDGKLAQLNGLMAANPMPTSQELILDRVGRELRGVRPLTEESQAADKKAFFRILGLLLGLDGFLGGDATAEALAIRYARILNHNKEVGDCGVAISQLTDELNGVKLQLWFLLSLAGTPFGRENADVLARRVMETLDGVTHITNISYYRNSAKRKMLDLANLQRMALRTGLPGGASRRAADKLDQLQYEFLQEERIVEKIDNPGDPLFARAKRLLGFAASDVLTVGQSTLLVRQRVQDHLRQPNFIEKYTAGVGEQRKREAMIRELHVLIAKAGLNGAAA